TSISLHLRLKSTLFNSQNLFISFLDTDDNLISNKVQLTLDKNLINNYQFIATSINNFNVVSDDISKIVLEYNLSSSTSGSPTIGFYVDSWKLQSGIIQP